MDIICNKFNMTIEENIFVANRNIIDYIWKSANLEGIAVTYPQTETIYNGLSVQGLKVNDILAINNLKHAWYFVLDNIGCPMDYTFLCKLNRKVGSDNLVIRAGYLRDASVSIGGTSWRPEIPIKPQIKEEINELLSIENPTDRALTLMLYCMRKQMFFDGNKRTAMLAGNAIMIANGAGIIEIPIEFQETFREKLIKFYETNDMNDIKEFLFEKCIDGICFNREKKSDNKTDEVGV